ncbi:MAG: Rpn family recombination-promoting nuclease/putative transposase [Coleofasciculus sp. G3-WIS-01]|uniref:Rpn family recombination-promoting nuclease/putative transposase n=1 Tax=Coleofasciculus sp. G3-WIS-01 TaxID=3069528 RepID=UPI0033017DE7
MTFINPKTDFAFKKIFGSTDSKDILISFLNALLYEGNSTIEDLEIIDPYLPPSIPGLKDTFLDVKAKITGNKIVIIEMQVLNVVAFDKRVVFNAAKTFATQLKSGEGYSRLNPVIALTITDFQMFPHRNKVISRFTFADMEDLFIYPEHPLELVFVELPNFQKDLNELETLTDKWIYFMKQTSNLDSVPETMDEVAAIQKAFRIANQANLSLEELETLEKQQMFLEDQQGAILKGLEQGRQQGLEQGRQQGKQEGEIGLILRLLERRIGAIAPEMQTRLRQLSSGQLEALADAVLTFTDFTDLTTWLQDNTQS